MGRHVAVLMGGWSAEREVSLVSGRECAAALARVGHRVTPIDVGRDLAQVLERVKPEVCFNALHGRWGEDGCVQGLLEVMGLAYTHSGVMASAIAMDKPAAKRIFTAAGLRCPAGKLVHREDAVAGGMPFPAPYVIKPPNEGSSVNVRLVFPGDNYDPTAAGAWSWGAEALTEPYIPGREIHVAVMGERALGAVEIRPKGRFYDYDAKYTEGRADHIMPAPIVPKAYEEALAIALAAHNALGCRGVSRADLRYDDTKGEPGTLYLLEVNTQPGMTPLSLVPEIAGAQGISFEALVDWMVEDAGCER
jgi:D-alanine-D-alanine ligase